MRMSFAVANLPAAQSDYRHPPFEAEVEQALREHPAIADACVVGLEDTEWGQRVAAVVVRRSQAQVSAAELIAFCRTRLAGYKQPRLIRFVKALPLTASGKVQRDVMRQQLGRS